MLCVLTFTSGCESVLDLNHDYTIRSDDNSGAGRNPNAGGTTAVTASAKGGVPAQGTGGASSGTVTIGGTGGSGGSTFGTLSTGGVGLSSFTTGGFSAAGDSGSIRTDAGGVNAGGATSSHVTTGGVATGGASTARANTGGLGAAGASSSRIGTGGISSGGSSSSRSTAGGVGGASSTRTNTNAAGAGAATAGTTGSSGSSGVAGFAGGCGSNCASCNHEITLEAQSATAQRGSNSASGVTYSSYQDRCPSNQVLIGYAGTLRNDVYQVNSTPVLQLSSLVAICGTVALSATGEVEVTPSSGLDPRGTDSTAGSVSQLCPNNQVVVGFAGHAGTIIDQIGFVCASLTSSALACCSALSVGSNYSFTPVGGTGGTAYSISCPAGQIALGQSLYTATTTKHVGEQWVSLFGLVCGTPVPIAACGP